MRFARSIPVGLATPMLAGCNRIQSAYHPFGTESGEILTIAWALMIGAGLIAIAMFALILFARFQPEDSISHNQAMRFIAIAGGVVPTVLLAALLLFALPAMKPLDTPDDPLVIHIEGEQFWWRMRYQPPGDAPVVTANELALPVGETVVLKLGAGDVLHSFWVPGLAGKMDMIPGRKNVLVVHAEKAGRFRGQCTEFCGLSHALMALDVHAMPRGDFGAWLDARRAPAADISSPGAALFDDHGCGGCHRVNGLSDGAVGPDLTHFAGRPHFGAGMFPVKQKAIAAFIRDSAAMKPGSRMPPFADMPRSDARAIADWLMELE